ncbi:hypothetical protein Acr_00g0030380 [Actinidia rufa]|uniref:Uncharacterized protein n=1 Tax=Actinidia rufa TaxID=165716 RepID=A0A7J0DFB4_9ERIC|nr:hypothetical protein Acr_00g0030380 [Actinidia rufa]
MVASRGNFDVQVILYPMTYLGIATDCCSLANCTDQALESIVPLPRFTVVPSEVAPALVGHQLVVVHFILLQLPPSSHGLGQCFLSSCCPDSDSRCTPGHFQTSRIRVLPPQIHPLPRLPRGGRGFSAYYRWRSEYCAVAIEVVNNYHKTQKDCAELARLREEAKRKSTSSNRLSSSDSFDLSDEDIPIVEPILVLSLSSEAAKDLGFPKVAQDAEDLIEHSFNQGGSLGSSSEEEVDMVPKQMNLEDSFWRDVQAGIQPWLQPYWGLLLEKQVAELRLSIFQKGLLACLKELGTPLDHPTWNSIALPPADEEGVAVVGEVSTTQGNELDGGEGKDVGGAKGESIGEENSSTTPKE